MKKFLSVLVTTILFATVALPTAYASGESNCQVVYGGGEVCEDDVKFTINKMVESATSTKGGTREYVENLTINDARYQAGSNINFKIVVENTGDRDITNLSITDRFPEYLTFVAGVGNANAGASEINFVIGTLKKGEKKEYVVTAKAADASSLPANQSITCVTNNVVATADNAATAEDNSQVCVEKNIPSEKPVEKPVVTIAEKPRIEKIPATGPEMAVLFGLLPMGAAGAFLRKKFN